MKKALHLALFLVFLGISSSVFAYELIAPKKNSEPIKSYTNTKAATASQSIDKLKSGQFSPEKKKVKKKTFHTNKPEDNKTLYTVFSILSITFSVVSLILSLFVSWVAGLLLLIPALLFLILALVTKPKKETTEKESKETYRDVLYLKNGSIVKGMIVEQIPNVSYKIETGDGSVFIYKFEEVEKITKEKTK